MNDANAEGDDEALSTFANRRRICDFSEPVAFNKAAG